MAEILKEGMLAEVIVLDRNLFEVKPKEILDTKVLVTIMDCLLYTSPSPRDA